MEDWNEIPPNSKEVSTSNDVYINVTPPLPPRPRNYTPTKITTEEVKSNPPLPNPSSWEANKSATPKLPPRSHVNLDSKNHPLPNPSSWDANKSTTPTLPQRNQLSLDSQNHPLPNPSSWDPVKSKSPKLPPRNQGNLDYQKRPLPNPIASLDTEKRNSKDSEESNIYEIPYSDLPKLPPRYNQKILSLDGASTNVEKMDVAELNNNSLRVPSNNDRRCKSSDDISNVTLRNVEKTNRKPTSYRMSDRFKKNMVLPPFEPTKNSTGDLSIIEPKGKSSLELTDAERFSELFKQLKEENNYMRESGMEKLAVLDEFSNEDYSQMLSEDFLKVENAGQIEDSFLTDVNNSIKNKFVDTEKLFIEKLLKAKIETKYDVLKDTFEKLKMEKYFGLLEELIEIHQEHFLPKFSKCFNISDLCDIFIESENELKMHLTDIWLKDPDHYKSSFAKLNNINEDFMKMPCEQLKKYLQGIQELSAKQKLSIDDLNKISIVSKMLTNILCQWIFITTWLKFILDANIDLKDIGYVVDREKCYVQYSVKDKKKKQDMHILFSEKYIILTDFKNPYYKCIDTLPLSNIDVIAYTDDLTLDIVFGKMEQKYFSLHFTKPQRLKEICFKLGKHLKILETSTKK